MAARLTDEERFDRAMLERTLQDRVLYRARKYGWVVAHAGRGMVGSEGQIVTPMLKGWPDLFLLRPPRAMAWELKRQLGVASEDQMKVLALLNDCGIPAIIVRPSHLRDKTVEKLLR